MLENRSRRTYNSISLESIAILTIALSIVVTFGFFASKTSGIDATPCEVNSVPNSVAEGSLKTDTDTTTNPNPNPNPNPNLNPDTNTNTNTNTKLPTDAKARAKYPALLPLTRRSEVGKLLEAEGFKVGVELGVKQGVFARYTLKNWPSCEKYYLVDIWKSQKNYVDSANVDDDEHEKFFQETRENVKEWSDKVEFMRMYTNDALKYFEDESIDYVYIDARHDYCGAMEDIVNWYPKVKVGGIVSGHDFKYNSEILALNNGNDWGLCENGERNEGAVRGAVEDFARQIGATVTLSIEDSYKSWYFRKY